MNTPKYNNKWTWALVLIALVFIVTKSLGPLSIPIIGLIMVIWGYILNKKVADRIRVLGKMILFAGITVVLISLISLSVVMPWGGTETKITVAANSPPVRIIQP